MGAAERIERAVAPAVSFSGLELVDVEVLPGRVRVTVDGPEGVDLDAIGTAARHISRALDGCEGAPAGHYELEVSSPGVERRLRRREHFEPLVGSDIAVRTRPGVEGDRRLQGRLTEVDDRGFRICGGTLGDGGRRIE
ncbi:MAG: ribosome maturation factor RimP, partial [Acidimicrobiales bacterium]